MSLGWKWDDCSRIRADLAQRQPVACRVEPLDPSGGLHGLEGHPAYTGLRQREIDDRADLVVVEPFLERDDQRGRDPVLVEVLERPGADLDQVRAAERLLRARVERVELKIHLEARLVLRQPPGELRVLGDPHAVGVDHQVLNRPLPARSSTAKNSGWIVGSPPEICTMSGRPSFRTTQSSMNAICSSDRCSGRRGELSA